MTEGDPLQVEWTLCLPISLKDDFLHLFLTGSFGSGICEFYFRS